jgi:Transglutaminase-like superfamily
LEFRGNDSDYYDPGNSCLDVVLDRRMGIPIHCCPKQNRTVMGCIVDRGFESGETEI